MTIRNLHERAERARHDEVAFRELLIDVSVENHVEIVHVKEDLDDHKNWHNRVHRVMMWTVMATIAIGGLAVAIADLLHNLKVET